MTVDSIVIVSKNWLLRFVVFVFRNNFLFVQVRNNQSPVITNRKQPTSRLAIAHFSNIIMMKIHCIKRIMNLEFLWLFRFHFPDFDRRIIRTRKQRVSLLKINQLINPVCMFIHLRHRLQEDLIMILLIDLLVFRHKHSNLSITAS